MSDLITITLVTGTERHESTEPVEAATEDPHQVWAQVLDYAARVGSTATRISPRSPSPRPAFRSTS